MTAARFLHRATPEEFHSHRLPDPDRCGDVWECSCGTVFVSVMTMDLLRPAYWRVSQHHLPAYCWRAETKRERKRRESVAGSVSKDTPK